MDCANWSLTVLATLVIACTSTPVSGQEVRFLDLADVVPRTELRHPPYPPPVCYANGTCTISGGIFGSVACGAGSQRDPRALRASLLSLDRFAYLASDRATIEVRLENTGTADMRLPWNPHLADLQPADETQRFEYRSLAIILELSSTADPKARRIITSAKLFGTKQKADSWVLLKPGEAVRLRLHTTFAVDSGQTLEAGEYSAHVVVELRSETFVPNIKNGGYGTEIVNDYPRRESGPALLVRIDTPKDTGRTGKAAIHHE